MTLFYLIKIDKIKMIVDESEKIWMKFHQPISNTPNRTPRDSTEPIIVIIIF